ncbi:MFS transporter [Luedemannella helvata]|uniref:MFS transporter n=1 Tax=Luedemannella helvata TaxID=349315 RepID=A0ABP4VXW1_9ACTN
MVDEPLPNRTIGRLLTDRTFGALFWGKLLTSFGVFIHSIVAAVVVFEATGSAAAVALVTVAQFGPQLALTPLTGRWADTGSPTFQILLGRICCVVGSASVAVWLLLDDQLRGWAVAVPVLVGSLLVGIGFSIGGPAMQSIVPAIVTPEELPRAMTLNTLPMMVARIAGPAVGAIVATRIGPAPAFASSAATHAVFALFVLVARFPPPEAPPPRSDRRVWAAVRHLRNDRVLGLALLAVTILGFGSDPSITLAPALSSLLTGDVALVGPLTFAFGCGAAAGLLVLLLALRWLEQRTLSLAGLVLLAAGLAGAGLARHELVAVVAFVVAGCGFGVGMASLSTHIQQRAPVHLRGRVMALWMVGFVGSRPLASVSLGLVTDAWSVRAGLIIAGVLVGGAAIAFAAGTRHEPDVGLAG